MRGYALMRQSRELESVFSDSPVYSAARIEVDAIRAVLPHDLPLSYRGIGRYPFTEYAEKGPGWQWEGAGARPPETEPRARALMLNFLGDYDYATPFPRAFLDRLEDARSVYAALREPAMYELVELCSALEHPRALLGFDVGYWGGGNFSLLCDAAIWPLWHPPIPSALAELSSVLSELNDCGLFRNESSANAYLEWYKRQPWAEKEPSEFSVIAVGSLERVVG